MPKASADRLAGLVDDVHFAARLPKHLILGAIVTVPDRHREEVQAEATSAGRRVSDASRSARVSISRAVAAAAG
jgi:hypothetical protein